MNSASRLFVILALVALQSALAAWIPWNSFVPDLLMLGVVFFSLLEGRRSGFWSGLALGLVKDAFSGGRFFWAIAWAAGGWGLAYFRNQIYRDAPHTQIIATLAFGLVTQVLFFELASWVQEQAAFGPSLLFAILPSTFTTALAAPLVLGALVRFSRLPA